MWYVTISGHLMHKNEKENCKQTNKQTKLRIQNSNLILIFIFQLYLVTELSIVNIIKHYSNEMFIIIQSFFLWNGWRFFGFVGVVFSQLNFSKEEKKKKSQLNPVK